MKKNILFIILSILIIQGCTAVKKLESLYFDSAKKVVLKEEGTKEFFYWEMDNHPNLWETEIGKVEAIYEYRDSLKEVLGTKQYKAAVDKKSNQNLPKDSLEHKTNGDNINAMLVLTNTVGKVRPINFLEAQILNYQLNKYPLLSHPTEFHGFIALNEKLGKVRVYIASSDMPWPPKPHIIIYELVRESENGWQLNMHLHNHYDPKETNYIGVLAPSLADAHYYKGISGDFPLEKALITNGFHTVEIDKSEFTKFESH